MLLADVLDPQGPTARRIDDLWWLMLALGVGVLALVVVLLVVGLLRDPGDPDDPASGTEAPPGPPAAAASPSAARWLVGGGVVLPVVVVTVVLVATIATMKADGAESGGQTLTVEIVGHQWWWEVRYPDHGVVTANEVHIPAATPVRLVMRSADVIHSFWVPALAGKIDLLPEDTTHLVLQADGPGRYRGQCAEFCGVQHAHMGVAVVAHSPTDFEEWIRRQRRPATATPAGTEGPAAAGRVLFRRAGCAECHTIRGIGASGTQGPDLTHLAGRRTIAAGTLPNEADSLRRWVSDPHDIKAGVAMPRFRLDDDDLDALVAYLESLR